MRSVALIFSCRAKFRILSALLLLFTLTGISADGQTLSTLASFDGANGANPWFVSLVQGSDGNFYGTTAYGGDSSYGTIFKVTPNGTLTTSADFDLADGALPVAALVLSEDGSFYGTSEAGGNTSCGGFNGCGAIFKIDPSSELTLLYDFCVQSTCSDGWAPVAPLIQANDGIFYSTTGAGGTYNYGTVFRIDHAGTLTTLHTFNGADGQAPQAGLILASDGAFYGTTFYGGAYNCGASVGCGTVYKMAPDGVLTTLHSFDGADGQFPSASLVEATDGNFYGTTLEGGAHGGGTIFKITLQGKLTTLYSFCSPLLASCSNGNFPYAGLVQATDGNFYGTTSDLFGFGTLFEITPAGILTTLYRFCSQPACADGAFVYGGLVQGTDGNFYGTTFKGGADGVGTVFRLSTDLGPFVAFVQRYGKAGQTGGILGQGFTGTTSVLLNGTPASFTVVSDTFIKATVPAGATTGYVTVTTPSGTLTSNVPFHVIP